MKYNSANTAQQKFFMRKNYFWSHSEYNVVRQTEGLKSTLRSSGQHQVHHQLQVKATAVVKDTDRNIEINMHDFDGGGNQNTQRKPGQAQWKRGPWNKSRTF